MNFPWSFAGDWGRIKAEAPSLALTWPVQQLWTTGLSGWWDIWHQAPLHPHVPKVLYLTLKMPPAASQALAKYESWTRSSFPFYMFPWNTQDTALSQIREKRKGKKEKKKEVLLELPCTAKSWDWKQFRCLRSNWDLNLILQQFNPFEFSRLSSTVVSERKKNHAMCLFIGRWASVVWWKWEDECQKVGQILFSVKQAWVRVGFFCRNWSWQHVNQHSFSWEGWERLFKVVSSFHAWLLATLLVPFHCILFIHAVLN